MRSIIKFQYTITISTIFFNTLTFAALKPYKKLSTITSSFANSYNVDLSNIEKKNREKTVIEKMKHELETCNSSFACSFIKNDIDYLLDEIKDYYQNFKDNHSDKVKEYNEKINTIRSDTENTYKKRIIEITSCSIGLTRKVFDPFSNLFKDEHTIHKITESVLDSSNNSRINFDKKFETSILSKLEPNKPIRPFTKEQLKPIIRTTLITQIQNNNLAKLPREQNNKVITDGVYKKKSLGNTIQVFDKHDYEVLRYTKKGNKETQNDLENIDNIFNEFKNHFKLKNSNAYETPFKSISKIKNNDSSLNYHRNLIRQSVIRLLNKRNKLNKLSDDDILKLNTLMLAEQIDESDLNFLKSKIKLIYDKYSIFSHGVLNIHLRKHGDIMVSINPITDKPSEIKELNDKYANIREISKTGKDSFIVPILDSKGYMKQQIIPNAHNLEDELEINENIFCDLLIDLDNLYSKGFSHNDIHGKNIIVGNSKLNPSERKAYLVDWDPVSLQNNFGDSIEDSIESSKRRMIIELRNYLEKSTNEETRNIAKKMENNDEYIKNFSNIRKLLKCN